jgi:glycosyltransferase involved in cell wall biosynthesis/MoaA/NifB/PqqE/SkfB family radical SAM enzyme
MKVMQVIHGYPMRYNAGSEVYTQTLCHALADRHEVHVFTRQEDPFLPEYAVDDEVDLGDGRIRLHVINLPHARDRYRHTEVDKRFRALLDQVKPDIVHIGHLNHLSTSLVREAAGREIPILFTLHDYWLMCPRGQFMQMHPEAPEDIWPACDGQENRECALRCYGRYFSGAPDEHELDVAHWSDWVRRRMAHVREMVELVDRFVAPARYLLDRFHREFGIPRAKLVYEDYGFDLERLKDRHRTPGEPFTFGYIGTHIPAKGIHVLLRAFARQGGEPRLRIWGRHRGQPTESLQAMSRDLPGGAAGRVEWLPEYRNQDIMTAVFNRVDAIVVPSIWVENSPLVIHEALQARVPVITADVGGMAEYVADGVNGLLFCHRDPDDLARAMQGFVDDPGLAARLGGRGYLQSETGDVPSSSGHAARIEEVYRDLITRRDHARVPTRHGPWRITFDTNPDDCNLHCVMCEEHSEFRPPHAGRGAERVRQPRRMPLELIQRTLADLSGNGLVEVIPSTMGEPLLYKHFEELLDLCAVHGVKLNLTTNGSFPRLGAYEWARRIVPVGSDVKISMNGATAETQESIMRGSRWARLLDNLIAFVRERDSYFAKHGERCRVSIQVTFMESNVDELPDLVRLAAEFGVDRVKGHHVWTHFDALKGESVRRSPEAIVHWNEVVARTRAVAEDCRLPNGQKVLLDNIFPLDPDAGDELVPGGRCPFLGQEAWVNTEGRFDPCCAPDELRRTLGSFGNLSGRSLLDLWNSEEYRFLVATYRNRHVCLSCNMRRPAEEAR